MATVTPASEWRSANRKIVTLPSGRSVEIRKLSAQLWLAAKDLFEPLLAGGSEVLDPARRTVRLSAEQNRRFVELLLVEAVVRPRVVPASREPAEDEVQPADFGPDLDPLVAAIQAFNPETLEVPFRAEADRDAAAPGGADLRPPAEPAGAGAAGGPDVGSGDSQPGGPGGDAGTSPDGTPSPPVAPE